MHAGRLLGGIRALSDRWILAAGPSRLHPRRRAVAGVGRTERGRQPRSTLGGNRFHLHSPDGHGRDSRRIAESVLPGDDGSGIRGLGDVRGVHGRCRRADPVDRPRSRGGPRNLRDGRSTLRPQPDDRLLRLQRDERGTVPLLPHLGGAPSDHVGGRRRRPPSGNRGLHRDGARLPDAVRRSGRRGSCRCDRRCHHLPQGDHRESHPASPPGPADGERTRPRVVPRLGGDELAHHRRSIRAVQFSVRQLSDHRAVRWFGIERDHGRR